MRTLEIGLVALADYLSVPDTGPGNWANLIDQIEKRIGDIRNPKYGFTADIIANQLALSGLAVHFRFLKDAWRNFAMHADAVYNEPQAEGCWRATRDFMTQLAAII
jgi:hypothetical protein